MTMKLSTTGGALLVAGTSIGAGMLGLPVICGPAGFTPSILVLVLCWAFMAATGLMFAELCFWYKQEVNILTMANRTLGVWGKAFAWGVYLFLFYSLLVAYLVGGGNLLLDLLPLSPLVSVLLFAFVFISVVALGRRVVDPLNKVCIIALFVAYFAFLIIGARSHDAALLSHCDWAAIWPAFPIAFTSFGFQGTIPTLASWMHYDAKKIRRAILSGTSISLVIYIAWQWLILGIVPVEGTHGIIETIKEGRDAVYPLHYFTNSSIVWIIGSIFAIFAIITSFLGVGIGLVDFWADGLGFNSGEKRKEARTKVSLLLLAFLPPLIFALFSHHIFLKALSLAGGFGSAFLLGLLPILMVFNAKFKKDVPLFKSEWTFLGKKWVLGCLIAFVVFEIFCELNSLVTL